MIQNHFGNGLMAGLQSDAARPAKEVNGFCTDYKRGFVLGFSHRLAEKSGDRNQAAFEAGVLSKRYGLDRELVAEFFTEVDRRYTVRYFFAGYDGVVNTSLTQ